MQGSNNTDTIKAFLAKKANDTRLKVRETVQYVTNSLPCGSAAIIQITAPVTDNTLIPGEHWLSADIIQT